LHEYGRSGWHCCCVGVIQGNSGEWSQMGRDSWGNAQLCK